MDFLSASSRFRPLLDTAARNRAKTQNKTRPCEV